MTDLWLGAEYNQNYQDEVSTDELMRQYLETGKTNKNTSFFEMLEVQVSCFGNPGEHFYDDVSRMKATGKHTEQEQNSANVKASIDYHVRLFKELEPKIVLIGGADAFKAWNQYIRPLLQFDDLTVIKLRNPSRQGHWGNREQWINKYQQFKVDLSGYSGLNLWRMKCSNINTDFDLVPLR